jgi:hypothetical protein
VLAAPLTGGQVRIWTTNHPGDFLALRHGSLIIVRMHAPVSPS